MKKPIHLVIDTNILRSNPPYKYREEYESLQRLIENDIVIFYLHYVVKEEYKTQIKELYLNLLADINKNLTQLAKKHFSDTQTIENILRSIDNIEKDTNIKIENSIKEDFYDKLQAKELIIQPNDTNLMFSKYFEGLPPFENKKSRKDIPDAFIFVSLFKMANDNKNVAFITNDNHLIESINKENQNNSNKIEIFKDIAEFLWANTMDEQIHTISKALKINDTQERIKELIKTMESGNGIESFLKCYDFDELYFYQIEDINIPTDDNTATIQYVEDVNSHTIQPNFEQIVCIDSNTFQFPITFEVEVEMELLIFKADVYNFMGEWGGSIAQERNDHYYEVEKSATIKISAMIVANVVDEYFNDIDFNMKINSVDFVNC